MQKFDSQMVDGILKKYPGLFYGEPTDILKEMACEVAFLDSLSEDFYCQHKCQIVGEMMDKIEDITEDDYKKFCDGLFGDTCLFNCMNESEFAYFMQTKFGWYSHEVSTLYFS